MERAEQAAGFTLLEMIVAIAFLSIVAIAVGQALVAGQKGSYELRKEAAVLASCEDLARQMSKMSVDAIVSQDGNTFTVDGVDGTGSISVTNPFLGSDGIAKVIFLWDGVQVLEAAFGSEN